MLKLDLIDNPIRFRVDKSKLVKYNQLIMTPGFLLGIKSKKTLINGNRHL